jgi:hypothetical protein
MDMAIEPEKMRVILRKGETLYRTTEQLRLGDDPCWFCFDEQTVQQYGTMQPNQKIVTVKTTRPLKLLNVCSSQFQADLQDRVNVIFDGNGTGIDLRKDYALCPFGLPDLETQLEVLNKLRIESDAQLDEQFTQDLTKYKKHFGERYRCSVYELDSKLVSLLKILYKKYDGYIIPVRMPTIVPKKGWFHKEICLFTTVNNIEILTMVPVGKKGGTTKKKAGGIPPPGKYDVYGIIKLLPGGGYEIVPEHQKFDTSEDYQKYCTDLYRKWGLIK